MINSKIMKKFISLALEDLEGEWLIIGGTVISLLGIDYRVTTDIDMVNLDYKSETEETLKLMGIAEKLDLPVESINQAGAYFLSKIDEVKEHIVLIKKSNKCLIYRPDVYLFLKLKLDRLTQTDFQDCIVFIENNREEARRLEKKITTLLKSKMKNEKKSERLEKLKQILEAL